MTTEKLRITSHRIETYGTRYNAATFDRVVGRVMFETTGVPSNWIQPCNAVDELWVPSKWGASRLIAAGIPKEKVFVVPQAVDVLVFNPATVSARTRSALILVYVRRVFVLCVVLDSCT